MLACLSLHGPLRLEEIRLVTWLAVPTVTELIDALGALVAMGLVERSERSEIGICGGMRCRVDYALYCLVRGGGEP